MSWFKIIWISLLNQTKNENKICQNFNSLILTTQQSLVVTIPLKNNQYQIIIRSLLPQPLFPQLGQFTSLIIVNLTVQHQELRLSNSQPQSTEDMFGYSHHTNQPQSQSPVQLVQQTSSRCLQQFNDLMKQSGLSGTISPPMSQSIQSEKQQISMLAKLEHSLGQRPSFEQLFLMEQEKKHLWELLALKEQNIQKLQQKLDSQQTKNKNLANQLTQKQQSMNKLKENEQILQQRQERLQNQLKKVIQIKNNIIQELNLIKQHFSQHQLMGPNLSNAHSNQINHKSNRASIPLTVVPQINTQTLELQIQHSHQTLKLQIANLKRENLTLTQKNHQLQTQLDQVLAQLRQIKLSLLHNLHIPTLNQYQPINHSHILNQQDYINNSLKTNKNHLNQTQTLNKPHPNSNHKFPRKSNNKFPQQSQSKSQKMPKNQLQIPENSHTNTKSAILSQIKSKNIQKEQFQVEIPKENISFKQKHSHHDKRNFSTRLPLSNESNKNIIQTSQRPSLGRKDKQCLRQLPIR